MLDNQLPNVKKLYTIRKNANAIKRTATRATPLRIVGGMDSRFIIMIAPSEKAAMMKISVAVVSTGEPPVYRMKNSIRR
jgi:hypothetical protein